MLTVKVYKLHHLQKLVTKLLDAKISANDRASTHEKYYALMSIREDISDMFVDKVEYDEYAIQEYFKDHPFKDMYASYRSTKYVSIKPYVQRDMNSILFEMTINNYGIHVYYDFVKKEFDWKPTTRKDFFLIKDYFESKIKGIYFNVIGGDNI